MKWILKGTPRFTVKCGGCDEPFKVTLRRLLHHKWRELFVGSVWLHGDCFETYLLKRFE